jgi:hypothetical protein
MDSVSRLIVISLISLTTGAHAARHALFQGHGLLRERSALLQQDDTLFRTAKSACTVDLSAKILLPSGLSKGDEILLNLPKGAAPVAIIDHVAKDTMGITTIRGRFIDDPAGYIILSTDGSTVLADISLPDMKIRRFIKSKKGTHYLVEPDTESLKALEGDAGPTAPQDQRLTPPSTPVIASEGGNVVPLAGVGDPATIDVMVAYTPAAKTWANANEGGISNVINQLMAKAQLACDNSQTYITMRLVHAPEVAYTETANANTDLNCLTYTDGVMDDVHALRTTYGADLVVLLELTESTGGIGWLLNTASGLPSYGFSITRVQQASWTYTTIHEIGHNMGCGHHKLQNTQPGPGLYTYSAGWRWIYNTTYYCDLMTYTAGSYFADGITHERVAYFSDPAISLNGIPTGHATDGNNALTLRQVKHTVAAYRATVVNAVATPQFSPVSGTSFSSSIQVSITCSTASATIRYTTNGSEPTTNSTLYTGPFTLTSTTTVRAKAFKSGMNDSATAVATYSNNRPGNDLFSQALILSGTSGSTTGTNVGATKEAGEPNHANISTATNSVWWTWTAPETGVVRFTTLYTTFDTVMAAYTGSPVNGLTLIASNDDYDSANGYPQSLIGFPATAGTTYSIAVAGYNGTNGTITLDWLFVPDSSVTTLQNGIPAVATGSTESSLHFKIALPSGASNLVITTSGGLSGQDCDLFALYRAPATYDLFTDDYLSYFSESYGNTEQITVATPQAGDWYIMLYGFSAYSGVTLKASYRQNMPVITTASLTSASGSTYLNMQFDANSGKTYNIQRKYALTNLNWTTIRTFTTNASQRVTLPITLTPGQPAGFYRLQMP